MKHNYYLFDIHEEIIKQNISKILFGISVRVQRIKYADNQYYIEIEIPAESLRNFVFSSRALSLSPSLFLIYKNHTFSLKICIKNIKEKIGIII